MRLYILEEILITTTPIGMLSMTPLFTNKPQSL
jgi:hypothetical protein